MGHERSQRSTVTADWRGGGDDPAQGSLRCLYVGSVRCRLCVGLLQLLRHGTRPQEAAGRRRAQDRPAHEPGRGPDPRRPTFWSGVRARFGVGNKRRVRHGVAHRPRNRQGGGQDRSRQGRAGYRYRRELGGRVGRKRVPPQDHGGYDNPEYSKDRNLTRVDPATNRVVEEIPIEAHSQYHGGAEKVAVGEGAVWVPGEGRLFKVDPTTNDVVDMVAVGDWSSHLAVYGGGVWAMVGAGEIRLSRVDPSTMQIVASEDIGPIPKIAPGA